MNNYSTNFWLALNELVASHEIKIDRRQGSQHPNFPAYIYPFDYGHVVDTSSSDNAEIDVWIGSIDTRNKTVCGIIVTYDQAKCDSEIKILTNCTDEDIETILKTQNRGQMNGILIKRPN